jgi:hypothetical protein
MADDESGFISIAITAATTAIAGLLSAAALAVDEDSQRSEVSRKTDQASEVIAACLYSGHNKKRSNTVFEGEHVKKKFICWDHNRAKSCIRDDYLGANPSFGVEDFKRIFCISRTTYERIRQQLCNMDPFFRDGMDVTKREKNSADAKIYFLKNIYLIDAV